MTALAQAISIDYSGTETSTVGKGKNTEWLWRIALAAGKPIFTLDIADNAHLIEICAKPIRENNTKHLLTGIGLVISEVFE